jgi:ABC-type dipeptide/oligopeptide/nickel transport system permease component
MPPLLAFTLRRLVAIPFLLLVITLLLYGGVMLTPPEARASLYMPKGKGGERAGPNVMLGIIKRNYLDQPFLVQYSHWIGNLVRGDWGYSPSLGEDVLPALLSRTPATFELAFYSLLLFIPLGLINGLSSGWHRGQWSDSVFRVLAYLGTSVPTIILALMFISFFYVRLGWVGPGRLDIGLEYNLPKSGFAAYTGLLTLDGLLNGRLDVVQNSFAHLLLPVVTLSLFHWATLGRITRATIINEKDKEYILAARARGIQERPLKWKHAYRNILSPGITSVALAAANIITGVYVVEIIYNLNGVSNVIVRAIKGVPDAPAALGFAIYSVLVVVVIVFILDIVQAILDPRVRDEVLQ